MGNSDLSSPDLLKAVLEPLLEDFHYWFDYSRQMLENEKMEFMSDREQSDLLFRVKQAQIELSAARLLFRATDGQVGIDMAALKPWHQLVGECWNVGMRFRQSQ